MGISLANPPEILAQAIIAGTGGTADRDLARAVAANAKRAQAWLEQAGARFVSAAARSAESQHMLAPPRRLDMAGLDWEGRGADLLMQRLEEHLRRARRAVVSWHACRCADRRERRLRRRRRATHDGKSERFDATAVVIADGGFAANPAMVAKYITPRADRVLARVGPGAKGDGIVLAEAAGAAIGGFGAFYGHIHIAMRWATPRCGPIRISMRSPWRASWSGRTASALPTRVWAASISATRSRVSTIP